MIRGLAQHITENDLRQEIRRTGLSPKDVRLVRKKDTGTVNFIFVIHACNIQSLAGEIESGLFITKIE